LYKGGSGVSETVGQTCYYTGCCG